MRGNVIMLGYEPQSRTGRLVMKVLLGLAITFFIVASIWGALFPPEKKMEAQHNAGEQKIHGEAREKRNRN